MANMGGSQSYRRADIERLQANVPQEMRVLPAWLLWKPEPPDRPGNKPKKVPYYVDGTKRGTTDTADDRSRLVTFDDVMKIYGEDRHNYLGPGFALGHFDAVATVHSGIVRGGAKTVDFERFKNRDLRRGAA